MWFLSDIDTYGKVNQCHADFLGRQQHDIEYRKLEEFFPSDVVDNCRLSNREVFESGKTIRFEIRLPDSRNRPRLLEITKTPFPDGEGRVELVGCCAVDITDRETAERGLSRSEDNFRLFIETLNPSVTRGTRLSAGPAQNLDCLSIRTSSNRPPGYLPSMAGSGKWNWRSGQERVITSVGFSRASSSRTRVSDTS
jgi:hypothetical protein